MCFLLFSLVEPFFPGLQSPITPRHPTCPAFYLYFLCHFPCFLSPAKTSMISNGFPMSCWCPWGHPELSILCSVSTSCSLRKDSGFIPDAPHTKLGKCNCHPLLAGQNRRETPAKLPGRSRGEKLARAEADKPWGQSSAVTQSLWLITGNMTSCFHSDRSSLTSHRVKTLNTKVVFSREVSRGELSPCCSDHRGPFLVYPDPGVIL